MFCTIISTEKAATGPVTAAAPPHADHRRGRILLYGARRRIAPKIRELTVDIKSEQQARDGLRRNLKAAVGRCRTAAAGGDDAVVAGRGAGEVKGRVQLVGADQGHRLRVHDLTAAALKTDGGLGCEAGALHVHRERALVGRRRGRE
jgi:hypothetical protein